jgi:hypothetical protein
MALVLRQRAIEIFWQLCWGMTLSLCVNSVGCYFSYSAAAITRLATLKTEVHLPTLEGVPKMFCIRLDMSVTPTEITAHML